MSHASFNPNNKHCHPDLCYDIPKEYERKELQKMND